MALGQQTFSDIGGGVSDLFAATGAKFKGQGARIEAEQYGKAAGLADLNAQYSKESTDIKEFQTQRSIFQTIGKQQAAVAASNFASSGSALDLLRDSATQGALAKAVLGQQGLIEEAGYEEQAQSFRLMQSAANLAATAADHAAQGATTAAWIKFGAAAASVALAPVTGGASLALGGLALSATGGGGALEGVGR